ncbi:putative membrane protein [hydrothermal vent metagenome]|uniref:Putative membrane protein n=1 Tax=hydrothermal vent metagenome TaxID=652676 RepID=A0A1W1CXI8_9ZZZZ
MVQHLERIETSNDKVSSGILSIGKNIREANESTKQTGVDIRDMSNRLTSNSDLMADVIKSEVKQIRISLEKSLSFLAEGANKEIIKALENVIQDFNTNLTEQFGDNFKLLNKSVIKMIEWQENYKDDIKVLDTQFKENVANSRTQGEHLQDSIQSMKQLSTDLRTEVETTQSMVIQSTQAVKESTDALTEASKKHYKLIEEMIQETQLLINNSITQITTSVTDTKGLLLAMVEHSKTELTNTSTIISESLKTSISETLGTVSSEMRIVIENMKNAVTLSIQGVSHTLEENRKIIQVVQSSLTELSKIGKESESVVLAIQEFTISFKNEMNKLAKLK